MSTLANILFKVRNLSRSLLVERLGGLAVSGELNVPSLPSLAIVQVLGLFGGGGHYQQRLSIDLQDRHGVSVA